MKVAVVVRELPIPVYTGLNLIIHNILLRLSKKHVLNVFVLDQRESNLGLCQNWGNVDFFEPMDEVPGSCSCALSQGVTFIERYYRTDKDKLNWLVEGVEQFKPKVVLGFGYDLLGYLGLLNFKGQKVLDVVDSEPLFLWREIKSQGLTIDILKHLVASVLLARKHLKRHYRIITVSKEDAENLKKITRYNDVYVTPNGVDCDFFCPGNEVKETGQVVFVGSLNWPPNQQAIKWFVEKCWAAVLEKKPNATLIIIGKNLDEGLRKHLANFQNIKLCGYVDDIKSYVRSSQVSIAPMVSGSGIKNKILESWAMEIPVVATQLGSKGIKCRHGKNILLADTPRGFSKNILDLLIDPSLAMVIGKEGRKQAVREYSWDRVVQDFDSLYLQKDVG